MSCTAVAKDGELRGARTVESAGLKAARSVDSESGRLSSMGKFALGIYLRTAAVGSAFGAAGSIVVSVMGRTGHADLLLVLEFTMSTRRNARRRTLTGSIMIGIGSIWLPYLFCGRRPAERSNELIGPHRLSARRLLCVTPAPRPISARIPVIYAPLSHHRFQGRPAGVSPPATRDGPGA